MSHLRFAFGGHSVEGNRGYQEDRYKVITNFNALLRRERKGIISDANGDNGTPELCNIDLEIPRSFMAVYDGTGGDLCVRYTRDRMHTVLAKEMLTVPKGKEGSAYKKHFENLFQNISERWEKKAYNSGNVAKPNLSASTALVVLIEGEVVHLAHVGNSIAYLIPAPRSKSGVVQLNQPHIPANPSEEARITQAGGNVVEFHVNREQVTCCIPRRRVWKDIGRLKHGNLALSRAMGGLGCRIPALGGVKGTLISEPTYCEADCSKREKNGKPIYSAVVLSTDGWSDPVSEKLKVLRHRVNSLFSTETKPSPHGRSVEYQENKGKCNEGQRAAQGAVHNLIEFSEEVGTHLRRKDNSTVVVAYYLDAFRAQGGKQHPLPSYESSHFSSVGSFVGTAVDE